MCMFCAAIPIAAATGAKLHADQQRSPARHQRPIGLLTALAIVIMAIASAVYHALVWPA